VSSFSVSRPSQHKFVSVFLPFPFPFPFLSLFLSFSFPFPFFSSCRPFHHHGAVLHAEVDGHGSLAADGAGRQRLRPSLAAEDADLENAFDRLDRGGELVDLPAEWGWRGGGVGVGIRGDQQRSWEGGVDDEKILVGLQGAGFADAACAEVWSWGAEFAEPGEDLTGRDGGDFDGNVGPGGEETGLHFAIVWKENKRGRGRKEGALVSLVMVLGVERKAGRREKGEGRGETGDGERAELMLGSDRQRR
jgi:hypothetical protein